jgi:hypothetical protein
MRFGFISPVNRVRSSVVSSKLSLKRRLQRRPRGFEPRGDQCWRESETRRARCASRAWPRVATLRLLVSHALRCSSARTHAASSPS